MFPLSAENRKIVRNIVEKLKIEKEKGAISFPLLTFEQLNSWLNEVEKTFVQQLIEIKPQEYGKKEPFLGMLPVPKNFKKIKKQNYIHEGEKKEISTQYLPKRVYGAYKKLNKAIQKDLNRTLMVASGYRSPAYQILVFLRSLYIHHNFDYKETMSLVALPGYSEHGFPPRQAIDFTTADVEIADIDFDKTQEYRWLLKNAIKYNFHLSYPKDNRLGIVYEPWHWHYKSQNLKS